MTDESRAQRLEELFGLAIEMPRNQRAAFLTSLGEEDRRFRTELESLLRYHERGERFLETPAPGLGAIQTLVRGELEPREEGLPSSIGPYRVLRLLGTGGMSRVYLAERIGGEDSRRVAIKVIRPGVNTSAVAARFLREGQALSALDHPHIARLYHVGTTHDGLPYLVMEYIDGEPLAVYCDRRALDTARRLEIFLAVCTAVEYAHRMLILHRDLKSSNILVTEEGTPKLLDFGIAKILDTGTSLEDATVTASSQMFFTPEYASPEQVRNERVSTATDVYSLGVVLYEQLTGRRPYRLTERSRRDIERLVCEVDPPRPSEVVAQAPGRPERLLGSRLGVPPRSETQQDRRENVRRRLRGDVDNIVMMALRKEPKRRYPSVEALADDLRRHLAGLPVVARKDTTLYRSLKFARRHKAGVAVLTLILALLVGATSVAVREAWILRQREVVLRGQGLLDELHAGSILGAGGREQIRQIIEGKAEFFAESFRGQSRELASFSESVASVSEKFNLWDLAVRWRDRVWRTSREDAGADSDSESARLLLARAMRRAGLVAEAEEVLGAAWTAPPDRAREELRPHVARERALILWSRAESGESLRWFEESHELYRTAGVGHESREVFVDFLIDFAGVVEALGEPDRAERLLREAESLARSAVGEETFLSAAVRHRLGMLLRWSPRFREGHLLVREALAVLRARLSREDPRLAACLSDMVGWCLWMDVRIHDSPAAALWREAIQMKRQLFGEDSLEVGHSLVGLCWVVNAIEASTVAAAAAAIFRKRIPSGHPLLIEPLAHLGRVLTEGEQPDLLAGEKVLREALEIARTHLRPNNWKTGVTEGYLGLNLLLQQRFEEAEPFVLESLEILERMLGPEHRETGEAIVRARRLYEGWGHPDRTKLYEERLRAGRWRWPFGQVYRDDDGTAEGAVWLDFEDDLAEKAIELPADISRLAAARLWVFAQPFNHIGAEYEDCVDHAIVVNGDEHQAVRFSIPSVFILPDAFQWVFFDIPLSSLMPGRNVFSFREMHGDDWKVARPWEFNNMRIGIDQQHDQDRSWWFGGPSRCCDEIAQAARAAPKPLLLTSPLIVGHRSRGYGECAGELMVFIELH